PLRRRSTISWYRSPGMKEHYALARQKRAREAAFAPLEDGELMYSACGLGSERTDLLVRLVREAGPRAGLCGAKIAGGGSGGTVAILARSDAGGAVARGALRTPSPAQGSRLSDRPRRAQLLPAALAILAVNSAERFFISSGATFSTCVAMPQ